MIFLIFVMIITICRSGPDNERPVVRRVRMEGGSCQEVKMHFFVFAVFCISLDLNFFVLIFLKEFG